MNVTPFFSIIIPVYQCKDFLKQTVKSVEQQTFSNIEIILIDDGSTDGSAEVCDNLASHDDRIIVIHKTNQGVSSARNLGIKKSQGKWLIFVDSDDCVSPVMCEEFFNYIKKSSLDLLTFSITRTVGKVIRKTTVNHDVLFIQSKYQDIALIKAMLMGIYDNFTSTFKKAFGNNIILNSPCAKAYNKKFIIQNDLWFEEKVKYSEDMLFNIQVLGCNARVLFVDDPVYFYRNNSTSATNRKYISGLVKNYTIFKEKLENFFAFKNIVNLQSALDEYTLKSILTIIHFDIFRPGFSIMKSRKRLIQVTENKEFKRIINISLLNQYKHDLDSKEKIKATLLLKKKFWILFFIYKVLRI